MSHIEPCERTHRSDEPCGQAGNLEDHPNTVLVADLMHADLKAFFAGIGVSLTPPDGAL